MVPLEHEICLLEEPSREPRDEFILSHNQLYSVRHYIIYFHEISVVFRGKNKNLGFGSD